MYPLEPTNCFSKFWKPYKSLSKYNILFWRYLLNIKNYVRILLDKIKKGSDPLMNESRIIIVNSKLSGGGQDRLNYYNISILINKTIGEISRNR